MSLSNEGTGCPSHRVGQRVSPRPPGIYYEHTPGSGGPQRIPSEPHPCWRQDGSLIGRLPNAGDSPVPRSQNSVPGWTPTPEPRRDCELSVSSFSRQSKTERSPFSTWVHIAFDAVEAMRRARGPARRTALAARPTESAGQCADTGAGAILFLVNNGEQW